MVRKEDLCEWFKNLRPCKRLDYMCGLLHMCLPTELRFIGTVIEDLAKKDYHSLRDAEIKANQVELSSLGSCVLADYKFRTKIIMALALLNSTNSSCASIIFDILEKQSEEQISNCLLHDNISDEILLILTMAVHHPAFKITQKLKVGETLLKVEKLIKERCVYKSANGGIVDEPELTLPPQHEPERSLTAIDSLSVGKDIQSVGRDNQFVGNDSSKKATVVSIEIIDCKDIPNSKKNETVKGYQIHSTWSNGEVREIFMRPKSLHDLHFQFLNEFPDEKKNRQHSPHFPPRVGKDEPAERLKEIFNDYLSRMVSVVTDKFPDSDVFTEPFRKGKLIRTSVTLDKSKSSVHSADSTMHNPLRLTNSTPSVQSSPGNSPSNSRTSSPPMATAPNGSFVNMKTLGNHMLEAGPSSHIELSLYQLLVLLNLDKYFDNLKEFSVKQVMFMSSEDFVKSGLPSEAHGRLSKKLDKLKHTLYANGMNMNESLSRATSLDSTPTYIPLIPFMSPSFAQFAHPPEFPHLGPVSLHQPPATQLQTGASSPVGNEVSSPPSSPLQSAELLPSHQVVQSTLIPVMSPPVAVASAIADLKATKQPWPQSVDAPEDDRVSSLVVTNKPKGRGRPQHSQSMPQINQSTQSIDDSKLSSLPTSYSVPHTHPTLISTEPRTDSHPYVLHFPLANGYAPDPPPQNMQGPPPPVIPRGVLALRPGFKTAQPTHTGQKNLIPMPVTYDMQHPSQGTSKSNGIHIPHYMPASSNPSNQILLQQNAAPSTVPLSSQPPPPSLQEGSLTQGYPISQMYFMPMPRLANSSATINSSQSLLSGSQSHLSGAPPHSHGPASLAASASPEQVTPGLANSDLMDSSRSDGSLLNPPSHTPPQHSLAKSQNNTSGPDSGTPSPPLGPQVSKQPVNPEPSGGGRGILLYNGYPQYIFPQQSLPNGLPHELLWPGVRFASHLMPNQIPYLYGNTLYSSHSPTIQPPANPAHQVVVPNQGGSSETVNLGKSVCYNCGQAGHDPSKCEENTMENMSKTYRLNYKPKSDSE